jgi:hypothetical protein
MRNLIRSRPSPAMVLSFVALLAALSGTAIALPGKNSVQSNDIKKNAVTSSKIKKSAVQSSDVKNSSLTGSDIKNDSLTGTDVNEATLGKVGAAATADKAGTATAASVALSVNTLRPFGPVTVAEGAPAVTLLTNGPLSVVGTCLASAANTATRVELRSTVTAVGAGLNDSDLLDSANPLFIQDFGATDAAGGEPTSSTGYDDQFYASVAGGATISGTADSSANASAGTSGTCGFSGYAVIIK